LCPCTESNPVETGFYWLQSRYYDPAIGRFINADGYASTGQGVLGSNMFAYCLNNPVNRVDPNGCRSTEIHGERHAAQIEALNPIENGTNPSETIDESTGNNQPGIAGLNSFL